MIPAVTRWALATLGGLIVVGNLAVFGAHAVARRRVRLRSAPWGSGTRNAFEVMPSLWRSGRPAAAAYEALTAAGGTTVIDLRAEGGAGPEPSLGLEVLRLGVPDGRAPRPEVVAAAEAAVADASGPVLVHCSAGVGRTGSIVAAHCVLTGGETARAALRDMLAVGPPTLEQIDFVRGLPGRMRPRPAVVVLSRILDAPRRGWSRLKSFRSR